MEGKIEVFHEGQVRQAKSFVKTWIKERSQKFPKVVDPYFGLPELEFLAEIPKDCKVLIVTTNSKLDCSTPEDFQKVIRIEWKVSGKGGIPALVILVVPRDSEGKFHCRAIVIQDNEGHSRILRAQDMVSDSDR